MHVVLVKSNFLAGSVCGTRGDCSREKEAGTATLPRQPQPAGKNRRVLRQCETDGVTGPTGSIIQWVRLIDGSSGGPD